MKVKIKDLEPNPFRDIENYPIDENKVRSLVNSINETGFWDNILARQKDDRIQLAYGHHRLLAIEMAKGEDFEIDIPIKELNDETMIRIMAEENHDYYSTDVRIVDETIKQVYEYLKLTYNLNYMSVESDRYYKKGREHQVFEGLLVPKHHREDSENGYHYSVISKQIADWLGKNWHEKRINFALTRMELYGTMLDKEAVQNMPNVTAAEFFATIVNKHKLTKEQQKEVAKKVKEKGRSSKEDIGEEAINVKYGGKIPEKEKKKEFEKFLEECKKHLDSVRVDLIDLKKYRDVFDSEYYLQSVERDEFVNSFRNLIEEIKIFLGEYKNETTKQLSD